NVEAVDLGVLVQRVVDSQRASAEAKGLELTVTGEHLHAPLLLDELRVAQVLRNLIVNAIKFSDRGHVEIRLQVLEGDHHLMIEVIDNGIGLSDQAHASLLSSSARASGSNGLGLVICQRLVQLMGGELTLSSLQGKGTRVGVRLPVEWAAPLDSPAQVMPSPDEPVGLTVLVVGGTNVDQQGLVTQLRALG
ncbi:histidine kinase, partial [Streptococcus danieliae]|nr:histidine kinase [Streptococcus danieliae]